jgi:Uma2 family endonuclease
MTWTATHPAANRPADAPSGERRALIRGVGWEGYEALIEWFADGGPRLTYADGDVEFMSPLNDHERPTKFLAILVETIVEELDIPCASYRSATLARRSADRGLEPDECYYLANADRLLGNSRIDLDAEPPPDLVIEVEITNPLLPKLEVYARLGFPEIWHYDGATLAVLQLGPDGRYRSTPRSRALPFVPMDAIEAFLRDAPPSGNETAWRRRVQAWARETLLPLHRNHPLGG